MAGKLQISTKLSGPWQNDNYCPPPPLKVGWSAILSAQLNGIFISIPKRHLFSNGARVAVVMVLPANLIISIERTQSGGGVKGRGGGSQRGGSRSQGSVFGATASVLLPGGYRGDPWPQTTTSTNERQGPVPAHFDR